MDTQQTTIAAPSPWQALILPIYLVTVAPIFIMVGSSHGWPQLVDFALSVGGAGLGIITQHGVNTLQASRGGTVNVSTVPPPPPPISPAP